MNSARRIPPQGRDYVDRLVTFFPADCLEGLKVVFYQHSCVSRQILPEMLRRLGAHVVEVGSSETFVPVDTEAVAETEKLAAWVAEYGADALVSADGDGDRPLVVDEKGNVVRGDVLGILVADFLEADSVSVPVSCNTALEKSGRFRRRGSHPDRFPLRHRVHVELRFEPDTGGSSATRRTGDS